MKGLWSEKRGQKVNFAMTFLGAKSWAYLQNKLFWGISEIGVLRTK